MFSLQIHGDMQLKRSIFSHVYNRNGVSCIYHALTILPIYFDSVLEPYVRDLDGNTANLVLARVPEHLKPSAQGLIETLCQSHLFLPQAFDEHAYLEQVRSEVFTGPRIRVLVLHLTDLCNLKCSYCFIEGGKACGYVDSQMSSATARRAVDKFAAAIAPGVLPKPPSVVFYGGEPLLNYPTLCDALEYLQQLQREQRLPEHLDKILITNGTKITKEIAQVLKCHQVSVSVSLDGPEPIHDRNRLYRSDKGSFRDSLRGYNILRDEGLAPTVSCVLADSSLDHIAEITHWLLDDLDVHGLGFNHVSIVPNVSYYDPVYEKRFAAAVIESQEIVLEHGDVYERRMSRKLNAFLDREILKADCTGCGEQMTVSPDGRIGICQGYMGNRNTFVGSVFDETFAVVDHPIWQEWSLRSPLNMDHCIGCPALAVCGGGCPRNAEFLGGSIWDPDAAFCHFAQQSLEWMLWKTYKAPAAAMETECQAA